LSDRTIANKIARYVSAVGNAPIVAATVFTVLIAFTRSPLYQLVIAIVFATLVPLGLLFYLTRKRIIPDLYASDRGSRAIAFVGVLTSYFSWRRRPKFDESNTHCNRTNALLFREWIHCDAHQSKMEDQRSRMGNNWSVNIFDLSIRPSLVSNLAVGSSGWMGEA